MNFQRERWGFFFRMGVEEGIEVSEEGIRCTFFFWQRFREGKSKKREKREEKLRRKKDTMRADFYFMGEREVRWFIGTKWIGRFRRWVESDQMKNIGSTSGKGEDYWFCLGRCLNMFFFIIIILGCFGKGLRLRTCEWLLYVFVIFYFIIIF